MLPTELELLRLPGDGVAHLVAWRRWGFTGSHCGLHWERDPVMRNDARILGKPTCVNCQRSQGVHHGNLSRS